MIRTDLYQDLEYRGIVKQVTDPALAELLSGYRVTLYAGFDPTSDSLHVGSLLPLLTLRRFQLAGHRPIAVVGGATGMIGDPSGKSQERNLLDDEQIAHNLRGISAVIARFLELKGKDAGLVVNNADWFKGMDYIRFLRDIGKHFTINHMMAKESVRARLEDREHGISYTEFSYMLLQAYDFYVLNRQNGCQLQIGGSDQWGNITAGIELIRRIRATEEKAKQPGEVFGMTHPLVSKSDGTKFGKTEKGTVWLDANRTSPYQFYQFFVQTADADVVNYLKFFTFLAHDEISHLEELVKKDPAKREAQTKLAREMTKLVHGEKELERAERASEALFGGGIAELDERTLLDAFSEAPSTRVDKTRLGALTLVDLLAETGLSGSKGAARKDIAGGGIYLNNERVSDPATTVASTALIAGGYVVLRKGKKTYHLVSFT
ncbi:MAG TPA: tyrosine--tRNA ligase [Bdellovibrionota bacterium]|nr:tyrosine--tRNA ligase [Bdellovibrionota bacterium]